VVARRFALVVITLLRLPKVERTEEEVGGATLSMYRQLAAQSLRPGFIFLAIIAYVGCEQGHGPDWMSPFLERLSPCRSPTRGVRMRVGPTTGD